MTRRGLIPSLAALLGLGVASEVIAAPVTPEIKVLAWRDADVAEVEMHFIGITDPRQIAQITHTVREALGGAVPVRTGEVQIGERPTFRTGTIV